MKSQVLKNKIIILPLRGMGFKTDDYKNDVHTTTLIPIRMLKI